MVIIDFFLRSEKSHVLCHWKLFDDNHLLSHILCKLSNDVRVDSNNFPTAISTLGLLAKKLKRNWKKNSKKRRQIIFYKLHATIP